MELNPADIQHALEEFTLDVAITYLEGKVRRQGRDHLLYVEEYSLLIRRGGALSGRKCISWEDASRLPLCLLVPEMLSASSPVRDLLLPGPTSSAYFETNSVTALRAHVRAGSCAAVLPRPLAVDLQAASAVECIAFPPFRNPITVGVAIPDRESTFPLAEAFFKAVVRAKACGG